MIDQSKPKWQVVYHRLRRWIGTRRPGDLLAPERDLARQYGVSVATVRRAMQELTVEGQVERFVGKGTFVTRASSAKPRLLQPTAGDNKASPVMRSRANQRVSLHVACFEHLSYQRACWAELIAAFTKTRPHVNVMMQWAHDTGEPTDQLVPAIMRHTRCDLIHLAGDAIRRLDAVGVLTPLDEIVPLDQLPHPAIEPWLGANADYMRRFSVPFTFVVPVWLYDEPLLARVGMADLAENPTSDRLLEACHRVSSLDDGTQGLGHMRPTDLVEAVGFPTAFGSDFADPAIVAEAETVLGWVARLASQPNAVYVYQEGEMGARRWLERRSRTAVTFSPLTCLPLVARYETPHWRVGTGPFVPHGRVRLNINCLAVNTASRQGAAALEFALFVASEQGQRIFARHQNCLPMHAGALGELLASPDYPLTEPMVSLAMERSRSAIETDPAWHAFLLGVEGVIEQLLAGQTDVTDAMDRVVVLYEDIYSHGRIPPHGEVGRVVELAGR